MVDVHCVFYTQKEPSIPVLVVESVKFCDEQKT